MITAAPLMLDHEKKRDRPLNPRKRPIKWADLSVIVAISNVLLDSDLRAAVDGADKDLRERFYTTLLKWEKAPVGPGIIYTDDSAISEDLFFTHNAVAIRVTLHVDCEALDANTRTIQGYVEEASAKFKMMMNVYEAGIGRGKRKAKRDVGFKADYD